jgi:hypothetical protein
MMPQLQMPQGAPQTAYPAPALTSFVNPLGAQVAGGLNALNQAAFGNIGAPTSEFGILPSAPGNLPTYTAQQFAVPQGGRAGVPGTTSGIPNMGGAAGPGGARGGNALQTALQRLGIHLPGMAGAGGPRGAAQGGAQVGASAARDAIDRFVGSNRMQSPSLANALKMGSMVSGPTGLAMGLGNLALGDPMGQVMSALGLGAAGQSAFNPGGSYLSPDALNNVRTAFNNALNPTASNINQAMSAAQAQMSVERAIQSFGPQPMAQMGYSPGMAAMIGQYSGAPVDPFRAHGEGGGSFGGGGGGGGGGISGGIHGGLGSDPGAGIGGGAGAANRSY